MNRFNSDRSSLANLELFRRLLKSEGINCRNTTVRDPNGMRMYLVWLPGTNRKMDIVKKEIMDAHLDQIHDIVFEIKLKLLF